jgi:hypothetical protein
VRNSRIKVPRFGSVMGFVLGYLLEGLMWLGLGMSPPFDVSATVAAQIARARRRARPTARLDNVSEHPGQLSMTPLSSTECAEWSNLVERLR